MKRGRAESILEETWQAIARWQDFARDAGVPETWADQIEKTFRKGILS